jgi:hypothetical protein
MVRLAQKTWCSSDFQLSLAFDMKQQASSAPLNAVSFPCRRFRNLRQSTRVVVSAEIPKQIQINVVVTCKGRLSHLTRTLPQLLASKCSSQFRVIVVDYGDPDKSFDWCRSLRHPNLVAIRVLNNTDAFNLSRARNCGANVLPGDALCFVDADSLVHRDFMEFVAHVMSTGQAVLTKRNLTDSDFTTAGVCCVRTTAFHASRGYDEHFEGWAPEDEDFYKRVGRHGQVLPFSAWLYPNSIPHPDEDRTRYYQIKNCMENAVRFWPALGQPERIVNPAGYGRASALVSLPEMRETILHWQIQEPLAYAHRVR